MLRKILREKIEKAVNEVVKQLDIQEILEEAAEHALYNYDIEETVIENIESIARDEAASILYNNYETLVEEALEDEFNIEEY